jgi:hypothetical protein
MSGLVGRFALVQHLLRVGDDNGRDENAQPHDDVHMPPPPPHQPALRPVRWASLAWRPRCTRCCVCARGNRPLEPLLACGVWLRGANQTLRCQCAVHESCSTWNIDLDNIQCPCHYDSDKDSDEDFDPMLMSPLPPAASDDNKTDEIEDEYHEAGDRQECGQDVGEECPTCAWIRSWPGYDDEDSDSVDIHICDLPQYAHLQKRGQDVGECRRHEDSGDSGSSYRTYYSWKEYDDEAALDYRNDCQEEAQERGWSLATVDESSYDEYPPPPPPPLDYRDFDWADSKRNAHERRLFARYRWQLFQERLTTANRLKRASIAVHSANKTTAKKWLKAKRYDDAMKRVDDARRNGWL